MKNKLMIFKSAPSDDVAFRDNSGDLSYICDNGCMYLTRDPGIVISGEKILCHASKKDIFSCLTDEEIDAEYRRRLIGKKVPFAEAPVGSYVLHGGEKWKVVFRGDTYRHKALEIAGKSLLRGIWDEVELCEPPEQKKNEELADLIKSMEKKKDRHTPGPWKVGKCLAMTRGEWLIHFDAGDRGVGISIAITSGTGNDIHNARLMAAAPEMLEALEEIVSIVKIIDSQEGLGIAKKAWAELHTCEAAIKKAKGMQ